MTPSHFLSLTLLFGPAQALAGPASRSAALGTHDSAGVETEDVAALTARARAHEEAGAFVEAAGLWSAIMRRADADARTRQQALFEAQGAYRLAYQASNDPAPLCRAWKLIDDYLNAHATEYTGDLEAEHRGYAEQIRGQLNRHRTEHGSIPCPEVVTPEAATDADVDPMDRESSSRPEAPGPGPKLVTTPEKDEPPPTGRGLVLAGGATIAISAALLGIMAYGTYGVVTRRDEILAIGDAALGEDRRLTADERERVEVLHDRGATLETMAITTGVLGGAALITGVTLVVLGARRSERRTTLLPSTSTHGAGIVLRGRF